VSKETYYSVPTFTIYIVRTDLFSLHLLYSEFYIPTCTTAGIVKMTGLTFFFPPQVMGVPSAAILSAWFTAAHMSVVVAVPKEKIKSTLYSDFDMVNVPGH
jgi:hypothetical protein